MIAPGAAPAGLPRLRAMHSLRAHSGLAKAVFLLVAVPGLVFSYFHGRPLYVSQATIHVAPNFTTTLQEPDELRDQANQYADFLHQQVLNIVRYEVISQALAQLGNSRDLWQESDETASHAVDRLRAALEVNEVHGSFSITVALAGPRREGLAEIVNAVADSYLTIQRTETLFAGDDRVKELEKYRAELLADMNTALTEKSAIAQELGVTSFDRTQNSPMQSQVDDTSKALGQARRDLIIAQSRLAALDASGSKMLDLELVSEARLALSRETGAGDAPGPLLARRGTLQASLAGMLPDNPAARVARAEIEEIDAAIAHANQEELDAMVKTLTMRRKTQAAEDHLVAAGDVERSKSLVASLETELGRLQAQLGSGNASFERGRNLESEMERTRRRIEEIDDRADMFKLESRSPGFARLDSPAREPEEPTRGGRIKYFLVFLVLASGLAVGASAVADALDRQIHGPRDLERAFGFPPLGWIREPGDVEATRQAEDQVRRLALGIEREAKRKGTRRFVITSVKPHQRTGALVSNLARELHGAGVKVLSVAADVRQDAGPAHARGLVDVLEHEVDPVTVIEPGPPALLPLGAARGLSRLPEAHRIGAALDRAGRDYEVVIVQAPPLLVAADAELLVGLSDATLIVVVAEEETLDEVRTAVRLLERLSPPVVGMVLAGVRDADGVADVAT